MASKSVATSPEAHTAWTYNGISYLMSVTAIIAAGGRGRRLGASVPKQLLSLADRSILQRSIDAFDESAQIDQVIAVLPVAFVGEGATQVLLETRKTPLSIVAGGERRQDSVARGFDRVDSKAEIVVVHDAARPFVTTALIESTIEAARRHGVAIAGLEASDTVKRVESVEDGLIVRETLRRDSIVLAQTPQAFRRELLREALELGRSVEATDEAMLAEQAGHPVWIVDGDRRNMKITTETDLRLAQALLGDRFDGGMLRTGIGYDIHRTSTERPLVLGGVEIASTPGLVGHSDADVLCHAVTDAILGAAGAGDIGRHFPDSDDRWKGASSIDLLRRAVAIIREAGFVVENVDVVVVAERPKIAPYAEQMRRRLADALGIDRDRVSVKGTTNERLGPVGREEGIAAHAVALVRGRAAARVVGL